MKEWIEAAYDTPVKKVNTANYEGKVVRRTGGKGYYKRPDYKVAVLPTQGCSYFCYRVACTLAMSNEITVSRGLPVRYAPTNACT